MGRWEEVAWLQRGVVLALVGKREGQPMKDAYYEQALVAVVQQA